MKLIVTGYPRTRTSQLVKGLANELNIPAPANRWGETLERYNEPDWFDKTSGVFKFWPIQTDNFIEDLRQFDGNIIVSYIDDRLLFVAKLAHAHIYNDWSITPHALNQITYEQFEQHAEYLTPRIKTILDQIDLLFNDSALIRKSAFIERDTAFMHLNSTVDSAVFNYLEKFAAEYTDTRTAEDYFTTGFREFKEYVNNNFKVSFNK